MSYFLFNRMIRTDFSRGLQLDYLCWVVFLLFLFPWLILQANMGRNCFPSKCLYSQTKSSGEVMFILCSHSAVMLNFLIDGDLSLALRIFQAIPFCICYIYLHTDNFFWSA